MTARMVGFGALWLAGLLAADEPSKPPADPNPETRAAIEARAESDAKSLGVTVAELKRLREFGYSDAEILTQIKDNKRTARQLITEHAVLEEVARALADVNQRVYKMPAEKQAEEREKSLKDVVSRLRWEHRTSKAEIRQILAKTSFLSDQELKRVVR